MSGDGEGETGGESPRQVCVRKNGHNVSETKEQVSLDMIQICNMLSIHKCLSVLAVDSSEALEHMQGSVSSKQCQDQCEREEEQAETNHAVDTSTARGCSAHTECANTTRPVLADL